MLGKTDSTVKNYREKEYLEVAALTATDTVLLDPGESGAEEELNSYLDVITGTTRVNRKTKFLNVSDERNSKRENA